MNTKNTKTAVIFLLIIANIFFVYNIIRLKISTEDIPSEMIDDAVSVLGKNGFIIDRDIIPAKKPAGMIYEGVYEGVYSQGAFTHIVKNFSGVSDEEMESAVDMFSPAGISYDAGGYRFIFPDLNNPAVSAADNFKVGIIEKSYDAMNEEETERQKESLSEKAADGVQKGDIRKAEKTIKNFLRKYQNQDVKLSFEIKGFEEDKYKGCECVLINQTVDGVPLDSHTAYVEIQDGTVKYFSGKWYFGTLTAKRNPLLDSVNILFKCFESFEKDGNIIRGGEKLKEMYAEYNIIFHDTEEFYIFPSWRLVFESGKKLSYNMITG